VAFLQNYYSLLPDNTDAAWQLLGPEARERSRGESGYESFWSGIAEVSLQNPRQSGGSTVDATVVFTRNNGTTTSEPYRFVIGTDSDGRTIVETFSSL
jgi:hypothetical protein